MSGLRGTMGVLLGMWRRAIAAAQTATIGSKNFTEGVVLGEIATLAAQQAGTDATHRRQLGGSRILWRALLEGEIDAYAEYTGTLADELLRMPRAQSPALEAALAERGPALTAPLGFDNSYAIGLRRAQAAALCISRLSDLAWPPPLRLGL
mgnify:CR=1 FL=1